MNAGFSSFRADQASTASRAAWNNVDALESSFPSAFAAANRAVARPFGVQRQKSTGTSNTLSTAGADRSWMGDALGIVDQLEQRFRESLKRVDTIKQDQRNKSGVKAKAEWRTAEGLEYLLYRKLFWKMRLIRRFRGEIGVIRRMRDEVLYKILQHLSGQLEAPAHYNHLTKRSRARSTATHEERVVESMQEFHAWNLAEHAERQADERHHPVDSD